MTVPREISQHLDDPDVIVIDHGDSSGRPVFIETGEDGNEVPRFRIGHSNK